MVFIWPSNGISLSIRPVAFTNYTNVAKMFNVNRALRFFLVWISLPVWLGGPAVFVVNCQSSGEGKFQDIPAGFTHVINISWCFIIVGAKVLLRMCFCQRNKLEATFCPASEYMYNSRPFEITVIEVVCRLA